MKVCLSNHRLDGVYQALRLKARVDVYETQAPMVVRPSHAIWGFVIFLVAFLEIIVLPALVSARLFAVVGIVSSISALHWEIGRRGASTKTFSTPAAGLVPSVLGPEPPPPRAIPAARGIRADPQARFPTPPRFDERGSSAHVQPWLLSPARSAPGVAADEAQVGDLSVRAASVVGPGHRCAEPVVSRQDAYQLGRDRASRYLVIAVADGVSASRHADLGAAVATRRAVDLLTARLEQAEALPNLSATEIFREAAEDMSRAATGVGLTDADVCAVIIVAAVEARVAPNGFRNAWIGWLGDVSAWQRAEHAWQFVLGDAKGSPNGLRSSEVESVLPMDWSRARQETLTLGPGETLALVTDGIGDLWSVHERANAYYHRRWSAPPPVASFLNDVCFDARGEQDDRTAVVVWAPGAGS